MMVSETTKRTKDEIAWITVLRGLACILVVVEHTLPPKNMVLSSFDLLFRNSLGIIGKPCVPLFFMITGYLILPYNSSPIEFYKRRIPRVLWPLLIWGIIYATLPFVLGVCSTELFLTELLLSPIKNPEEMGGILWYLYILIGIYLFIPFLSTSIYTNEKLLKLYLSLWFFTLFLYIPTKFFPNILGKNPWEHDFNLFVYFSGYLGYVLLGYWVKLRQQTKDVDRRPERGVIWIIYLLLIVVSEFVVYVSYGFLTFGNAIMAFCLFIIVRDIGYADKSSVSYKAFSKIAKYSFGIYVSHILIYRTITCYIYTNIGTGWSCILLTIMSTVIGSLVFVRLISLFSFHRYIIG